MDIPLLTFLERAVLHGDAIAYLFRASCSTRTCPCLPFKSELFYMDITLLTFQERVVLHGHALAYIFRASGFTWT